MIIIKKSKIIVDAFTSNQSVYDYSQLRDSSYSYPEWFKRMPNKYKTDIFLSPTLKKCVGLQNIYSNGYMIPLWSDLSISIRPEGLKWQYADNISQAECHDVKQWEHYTNLDNHYHLKLITPWRLVCKEDIKFYMIEPSWNYSLEDPLRILKGVVDFKHQHSTHINMFINKHSFGEYLYNHGTPMYHILPISERKLIIKHHLVSEKEIDNFKNRIKFLDNYKYISRCPFK